MDAGSDDDGHRHHPQAYDRLDVYALYGDYMHSAIQCASDGKSTRRQIKGIA